MDDTPAQAAPEPAAPAPGPATGEAATKKQHNYFGETSRFLILLFLFALLLRTLVFAPFSIPSGSMLPNMAIGDYLFVSKWPYGYSRFAAPFGLASFEGRIMGSDPERGDVIVFRLPGSDIDYVKRLIALPGDTVEMRGGIVILNGEAVPKVRIADFLMAQSPNSPCRYVAEVAARPPVEEADGTRSCRYERYRETLPGGRSFDVIDQFEGPTDDTPVFSVPEGHYFVMGDNRDDSADSRVPLEAKGVGLLRADHVIGRASMVFFSTDGSAQWLKPWTWFSAARWDRVGRTF
jgi:signal peptidase I